MAEEQSEARVDPEDVETLRQVVDRLSEFRYTFHSFAPLCDRAGRILDALETAPSDDPVTYVQFCQNGCGASSLDPSGGGFACDNGHSWGPEQPLYLHPAPPEQTGGEE
jgi:hypothetical protein